MSWLRKYVKRGLLLLLVASLLAPAAALARERDDRRDRADRSAQTEDTRDRGRDAGRDSGRPSVSLDQAVRIAQSAYDGKVIAASNSRRGDRAGYRIRLLLDGGRVKTLWVDANSGAVSGD